LLFISAKTTKTPLQSIGFFTPVDRNSAAIDVGDLEARAVSILPSLAQNFKDKKKK